MTDEDARTVGGRYSLDRQVVATSDHQIWLGTDQTTGRPRAVKLFTGAATHDPRWQETFERTAGRLERLTHPGVVATYASGIADDTATCWLAMARVEGEPFDLDRGATTPERLDVVGQVAFAVAASHAAGISHGAIEPSNVIVDDGVVTLIGFRLGTVTAPEVDVTALRRLATDALADDSRSSDQVAAFTEWLAPPTGAGPTDPAEIGRVSLALAASLRDGLAVPIVPADPDPVPVPDTAPDRSRADRRRVRNGLIVVAAVTVLGGGLLLRFVGEGGGQVTVPSIVDLPVNTATVQLTSAGLNSREQYEPGSGDTVTAQLPAAGERVKAGSTVTLVIGETGR